ncbi:MAG: hypothetical protein Q9205_005614 [Flavoplaca limonia]
METLNYKKDVEYSGFSSSPDEKHDAVPAYEDSDRLSLGPDMTEYNSLGFWTRNGLTLESFKRRKGPVGNLNATMKPRHLHMIAIGGSIGAGLFVGSGSALSNGGPAALLLAFGIIGIMIFNVVYALGELAVVFPVSGGFYTYSTRFIDPSWGFAMGWNYVFQWAIVLPLELTVAGLTVEYWQSGVSVGVWITVFWLILIFINVFGTLGYAEEEFWSSLLKLCAIVIFMIIGVVLCAGGGPADGRYNEYWGARTFYNPGAFANGFKGVCAVFVTAAFAFSGTELVGLAAAESANPAKALPGAIKQVFWRITLFYVLALLFVGLLVPHTDERLLGSGLSDSQASPFVIAAKDAGLIGFDSFMNVVILVSVISIGNSGVYGGSRTLTALAEQGYAPKFFAYIDKSGRPLFSVIFILAFSPIAYVGLSASGEVVFAWLLALSGLAALFTWGSICLSHIRFRKAWKYHGHTLDEIPFKAIFGVYGSWIGLTFIFLVLVAQFAVALYPLGGDPPSAEAFFQAYLALPVVLAFWIGGYFWKRSGWLRTPQIDVNTNRRVVDWDRVNGEKARASSVPNRRFFDAAFNRSFREETTQSVHLPEDDPKIFDVIHKFLYTGLLTIPHEGEDSILSFSECLDVYVMGDKLDLLEACDAATTRISTLLGHSKIISTKSILSVYERTGSTSLLRRFIVAVMVQNLQHNIDEITVRKPEALTSHPEILLDLLAQLKHDVTAIPMPTRELKLAPIDVCDYHHHQFHEGKCRIRRKPEGYSEVKLIMNHVTTKRPRFYVVDSENEEDSDSTDTFRPV